MDDLTSTQGIVALAAAGRRAGRPDLGRRAAPSSCAACAPRSARCSAPTAQQRPRRPRRRAAGGVRRSCATGSRRRPPGSTGASARPSGASTAASPTPSLIRYDAYGEMSGHQSSTHGAARLQPHRRRRLLDPPPRPGARVREAAARRAWPSWSCRRRSRRRSRRRCAARRPGPEGARASRLPRSGGDLQRRGAARVRARPRRSSVPCTGVHEAVMAVQRGEVERAIVPMENSIEGGVSATLDALAGEADDVRIAGEVVRPIQHCLIAARRARAGRRRAGALAPAGRLAQCARFLRERLPQARASWPPPRPPTPCARCATRPSRVAALGSRFAAELYGCEVLAENVADQPGNVTRFVWLRPRGEAPVARTGRRRRRSSSGAPATRRPAGWSACSASWPSAA